MKVLIASPIDPDAIENLRRNYVVDCEFNAKEERLSAQIRDADILIFRSGVQITSELMRRAPRLRLLIRAGSGMDNLDIDYVRRHNIELRRISKPGAVAVAEMTLGLMLALARNIVRGDRLLREGKWAKYELAGTLLSGRKLGIVGCGRIGTRVGQLGTALGMHAIGCVGHPSARVSASLRKKGIALKPFREVVSTADFVAVHVPLTHSTRHLFNEETFRLMKRGAFLINMARGEVVQEGALLKALTEERLSAAALDVHQVEGQGMVSIFAALPNVILTPHVGSMTTDTQFEIGRQVVQIVRRFHEAERMKRRFRKTTGCRQAVHK